LLARPKPTIVVVHTIKTRTDFINTPFQKLGAPIPTLVTIAQFGTAHKETFDLIKLAATRSKTLDLETATGILRRYSDVLIISADGNRVNIQGNALPVMGRVRFGFVELRFLTLFNCSLRFPGFRFIGQTDFCVLGTTTIASILFNTTNE